MKNEFFTRKFEPAAQSLQVTERHGFINMQITDVRVRKLAKEGKMKAVVSITLDDQFVVHDIKVIEGEKGLFIAMPSKQSGNGEYRDVAHPINAETRDMVQRIILQSYEEALNSQEDSEGDENLQ